MGGQWVKGANLGASLSVQAFFIPFSEHAGAEDTAASNALEHFVVEFRSVILFRGFALWRGRRLLRLAFVRLALATRLRFGSAHDCFSCALTPVDDAFRTMHPVNARIGLAFQGRMQLLAFFVPRRFLAGRPRIRGYVSSAEQIVFFRGQSVTLARHIDLLSPARDALTGHAHCRDDRALVEPDAHATSTLHQVDDHAVLVPNVRITLASPPRPEVFTTLGLEPLVIGSGVGSDLLVADRQVSRRHCELKLTPRGIVLRDLGSKNGTFIDHVPIIEAILDFGRVARIGNSQFTASAAGTPAIVPLSMGGRFGEAVGNSIVMRALFAKLERASATAETILLLGESGTGKEVLARAVHEASPRKNAPFVVLDCGAVSPALLEAELFGHTRGAFTGAATARTGLLEEAGHGTLFIDEIGEMPLELQPKLLRALEAREIRRLGSAEARPLHARVIAATHRNLRANMANGSFREDLYYRLAVVEMHVPALRDRKEDIPLLVEHLLQKQQPGIRISALPPQAMNLLMAHDWPGNVRELRNAVTRLLLFPDLVGDMFDNKERSIANRGSESAPSDSRGNVQALLKLSLKEMREVALEQIEARYLAEKLRLHRFNISRMAEDIGVSRTLVYRLLERHGLRPKTDDVQEDEG